LDLPYWLHYQAMIRYDQGRVDDFGRTIFDAHRMGASFLLADLDMAMTFLDMAETSHNRESSQRNQKNARTAHDTFCDSCQG
jgi:hypothetical protein